MLTFATAACAASRALEEGTLEVDLPCAIVDGGAPTIAITDAERNENNPGGSGD